MYKLAEHFASLGIQWPLEHPPYRGQEKFLGLITNRIRPVELVVLPTGYGKTILQIICAAYWILSKQVRHVIVLVPKDNLRSSMIEEWQTYLPRFVPHVAILHGIRDKYRLSNYTGTGQSIVLIATYQQIDDVLLQFCDAFPVGVLADEAHHLYDVGVWARNTASLLTDHKMYFTATPYRGDYRPLRDVPTNGTGHMDPLVQVLIRKAQDEGALCKIRARAVQFWVDVETDDGVYRVTTDTLDEEREDFSTYEAKKQLRYTDGFTTPLIEKMLLIHNQKHVAEPYMHQILVKAMTAHHADALCRQINDVVGFDDFAHSVHIHKPAAENEELLARFRGVRLLADGTEVKIEPYERFPCLVQVEMAGEGYNNPYISTLVKADLTRNPPYITQLIGRALRVNYDAKTRPQIVDVLVPDDDKATIELIEREFAIEPRTTEPSNGHGEGGNGVQWWDIPDVMVIEAGFIRLYELDGLVEAPEDTAVIAWADGQLPDWRRHYTIQQVRSAYVAATGVTISKPEAQAVRSETAELQKWQKNCNMAAGTLAANVIRILSNQPAAQNKRAAGNIKRAVNTQWVRLGNPKTQASTVQHLKNKHAWIQAINREIRYGNIPHWLSEVYYASV